MNTPKAVSNPSADAVKVPWHAAYPPPKCADPPSVSRTEILRLLQDGYKQGKDFILIDLRSTDHEGGTIHGSINLPAPSLYPTIPTLYAILSAAGVEEIVWYCGSSKGWGTRAAGWFADYIKEQGDRVMASYALEGGIDGWARAGEEYVKLMDGYQEAVWRRKTRFGTLWWTSDLFTRNWLYHQLRSLLGIA